MSKRRHGLSTRAIHSPPRPPAKGEPLVEPIVASTTFSFEHVAELGAVIAEEEHGFTYARLRNPTVEELNAVLAELESAEAAQTFGSGMGAISAALHSTLSPGDTLLLPRQLYGTTYQLAESQLRPRGVELVYLDVTDPAAWERRARVRFVETMANPGFPLADLSALAATKGDGLLIVDNTFASPMLCRPLELGADLVCESATKYLNGHHDVMAGAVAGSRELVAAARLSRPAWAQNPLPSPGAGEPERSRRRQVPGGPSQGVAGPVRRPGELPTARARAPAARGLGRDDGLRARRRA
jgi:methionine-gamma-lyase